MHLKSHASTSTKSKPIVIIAHSARALAESATRAGYTVVTVDGFADVDTVAVSSQAWCLPLLYGEFDQPRFITCLHKLHADIPNARVIAGAGCEPYMSAIETLQGWQLLGNSAASVRQVCEPGSFFAALDRLSIPHPAVEFNPPSQNSSSWLYKTPYRCGGLGIRRNKNGCGLPGYWQQEQPGIPISALCLCSHGKMQLIGINRQFTCAPDSQLPYIYSGALANYDVGRLIYDKLISYISILIEHFNLIGICSIDMLLHGEDLTVLEINPRVSATYELYEWLSPKVNLIDAHIRVCEGEPLLRLNSTTEQCAYSIVYADDHYTVPAIDWPPWCSDRPEYGRALPKCDPICTVRALSGEAEDLYNRARQKGQQILSLIKQKDKNTN